MCIKLFKALWIGLSNSPVYIRIPYSIIGSTGYLNIRSIEYIRDSLSDRPNVQISGMNGLNITGHLKWGYLILKLPFTLQSWFWTCPRCILACVIKNVTNLVTVRSFNQTMSQLFQSTMRESDPKLTPELFDHNSASETAT